VPKLDPHLSQEELDSIAIAQEHQVNPSSLEYSPEWLNYQSRFRQDVAFTGGYFLCIAAYVIGVFLLHKHVFAMLKHYLWLHFLS
jgi:hypothetical protein